ncbi:MAG: 50S ribosomal protein L5 [Candidatus Calescibacterium sp.]|jgi:large subunit ribosomal protein L5|nr:50S ribosomal protein L5 [Candidatus Calescibacterium sp.]
MQSAATSESKGSDQKYIPRLKKYYFEVVVPKMMGKFKYENPLEVPRLYKIVVNMGVGKWKDDANYIQEAIQDLSLITGQKPVLRRARKAIAGFHLKKGEVIGLSVCLRGNMMYDFFDRLINIAMPRAKDFKGFWSKGFDGKGNYNIGIKEHTIFPEVPYAKIKYVKGMNVTIVTTAETDEEAKELLKLMGMPFRD